MTSALCCRVSALIAAGTGQKHAHAGELGFRDFPSLSLVKENRRHLGNPACGISIDDLSQAVKARILAVQTTVVARYASVVYSHIRKEQS